MPVYRRLFTITRDDNRNHLPTTGRVPPSLQSLTKDVLLQSLASVFRGKNASWYPDQIWRDERWIQLKGYLHQLPLNVLQDIFEEVDSFNENHDQDCQLCEEKHRPHWMVSLNQRSFYVWWLFFDEKQTKELRTKFFSRETMEEYLSSEFSSNWPHLHQSSVPSVEREVLPKPISSSRNEFRKVEPRFNYDQRSML